jgi:phospholipase/carboxylesterase
LHGWSGDENVMWVLQTLLPEDTFLISARGIHPLPMGGYHWSSSPASTEVAFNDFAPAIKALRTTLDMLHAAYGFGHEKTLLMGFSQGAALAFSAACDGIPTAGIIALAGFIPQGDVGALGRMPVFWGHGTHDDLVPVQRAREDVKRLLDASVEVHYCEADVGHKLGIECTRGLRRWLQGHYFKQ